LKLKTELLEGWEVSIISVFEFGYASKFFLQKLNLKNSRKK